MQSRLRISSAIKLTKHVCAAKIAILLLLSLYNLCTKNGWKEKPTETQRLTLKSHPRRGLGLCCRNCEFGSNSSQVRPRERSKRGGNPIFLTHFQGFASRKKVRIHTQHRQQNTRGHTCLLWDICRPPPYATATKTAP